MRQNNIDVNDFKYPTPALQRRRMKHRPKLQPQDFYAIAHKVICQHHIQKHVAKEFRVSNAAISSIVQRFRKNPASIEELDAKQAQKE